MILEKIELRLVQIPLRKPFKTALRIVETVESLQVKLTLDTGEAGYGAASPTVVITGDTTGSIEAAIQEIWIRIKGRRLDEWDDLMGVVHRGVVGNTSAKAAIDIALHDLRAKLYGVPLFKLMGGARQSLESDMTISLDRPEIMASDAATAMEQGFEALKIKLGNDAAMDIQRMKAIHDVVQGKAAIRLDANQGWSRKEAVRSVMKMLDSGIDIQLVEQPVAAHDFEGMKYVTENLPIPVLADESVFSFRDAVRIIQMGAADWINIKLMKTGGIQPAMQIASLAESFGVKCMIGCMMEGPIGISAAVHLGCGRQQISLADLDVPFMYRDALSIGFETMCGSLRPGEGVGLGLEVLDRSEVGRQSILF